MEDASCFGLGLWESSFGKGGEGRETVKGGFCPSCAHGPLGFINKGAGDVSTSCGVVCLRRSARAFFFFDSRCKSFGIK